MSVIADPKAIAARRATGKNNTTDARAAQLQAKRKRQQEAQAKEFRKAHGLD